MLLSIRFVLIFLIIITSNFNLNFASFEHKNCLKRQCFEKLGCFSTQTFIDEIKDLVLSSGKLVDSVQTLFTLKQLLSICPISPSVMNVTFILFSKESNESQKFSYNPTTAELKASNFSPKRRNVFIIHGYTDSYKECDLNDCQWMAKMKNYFIELDYNVIAVDWSTPAFDLNYFNSAFNSQIAGSIVAFFINRLIHVFGVKAQDFHLVGHSLGAHVAGFAGKRFNRTKIGHISGLDPAGPGFSKNRLSPDDANLVIAIHTSAGILKNVDENIGENPIETIQLSGWLGCPDPLGHFDFWPNGGNGQPGCEKWSKEFINEIVSDGLAGLRQRLSCNHERATQLPTAEQQLRQNSCQLIGYECDSYDDFNDGKCADCGVDEDKCKPLEFFPKFWQNLNNWENEVKRFPKNLYIKTTDSEPFCLFHYQIVVTIQETSSAGEMKIRLFGRKLIEIYFNKPVSGFKFGQNYTQLVTDSEDLGQITEADVVFDNNILGKLSKFSNKLNPFGSTQRSDIRIERIGINFMSHIDRETRQRYSSELFPDYENSENENSFKFRLRK